MRELSEGLAAHLAGGVTTLARCWTLTRRDGEISGYTDHDRDLTIGGVVHRARAGLEAAEASQEAGFAVASADVVGVLQAAGVTENDIALGLYDSAAVTVRLVDWTNPDNLVTLGAYEIGQISRSDTAFVAELRSLAHRHDEERGRIYTQRCDADLGDARCGVSLVEVVAAVQQTDGRRMLTCTGLSAHQTNWFDGGLLRFTSGANNGSAVEIRSHRREAGLAHLELWLEAAHEIVAGDAVRLRPGCDKSFATCRAKFANGLNFQGFPHIPGADFLLQRAGEQNAGNFDGGSLFR